MFEHLREYRKKKRITARELADVIGAQTVATYYKKETGKLAFTLMEAKKIADFLGGTINEVFFGE